MLTIRRALLLLVVTAACVPPPSPDGSHELHTHDRDHDRIQRGIVTCNPRSAVGYDRGAAFTMTIVDADGRPAEISTANAYDAMQAAARRDGVFLQVVSAFRSYEQQAYLYSCYVNCSCNNCNLAARPGYSNHNSGYALDLNTHASGVLSWLNRNGSRFGFARTVPSEPWHWEYFGSTRHSPCGPSGSTPPPPTSLVRFDVPRAGGSYTNGVWLKVEAPGAALVEYESDGFVLGASEDADDNFSVRYIFHQLGRRSIDAIAYRADGSELDRTTVEIDVVTGDTPQSMSFVTPSHRGWYRNGVWMHVDAPANTAEVRYYAGSYFLGASTDPSTEFGYRYVFYGLGRRALVAVAHDANGNEIDRRSLAVRVLPGDEQFGASVELIAPAENQVLDNGGAIRTIASDSITSVVYDAGGFEVGRSSNAASNFEVRYRWSQTGTRTLRIRGYDATGALRAETTKTIEIRN